METLSSSVWQRKGSSVVFDGAVLGPLISEGAVVSLREALGWLREPPSALPVPGRTVLISGLQALVETLPPEEVTRFLVNRVEPLIKEIQGRWPEHGVVFGFAAHQKAFTETPMDDAVLFHRRDRHIINLSDGLWNGSAPGYIKRIVRAGDDPNQEVIVGYYVGRLS
ncbi:MAG: hypothetical protein HPY55_01270 [Firmicutes bacterium]|nr:hypothetical protein [Bacillota bacterium]